MAQNNEDNNNIVFKQILSIKMMMKRKKNKVMNKIKITKKISKMIKQNEEHLIIMSS